MAGLLAASGRVEPGEELAEEVVELRPPVGREVRPHRRRVARRCRRRRQARGGAGRRVVSGMRLLRWGRRGAAGVSPPTRRINVSSGSPFEDEVGYSRAVRVGPLVVVAPSDADLSTRDHLRWVRAFVCDGTAGINLALGTWHWGPYPLMDHVDLVNVQGRGFADDNEVAHLARDLGVVVTVRL